MKEEVFGSVMLDGKMINLDKDDLEKLQDISSKMKDKCDTLKKRTSTIFNQ